MQYKMFEGYQPSKKEIVGTDNSLPMERLNLVPYPTSKHLVSILSRLAFRVWNKLLRF